MANRLNHFITLLLLLPIFAAATANSLDNSPSPAPQLGADSPVSALPPDVGAPASQISSPPAPPPETEAPAPAPAPVSGPGSTPPASLPSKSEVPAPSPSEISDINHNDMDEEGGEGVESSDEGGLSGGKKAGIAVGVIAAACLVGLGGFVYKKRQDNVRRSQYGYAARREML